MRVSAGRPRWRQPSAAAYLAQHVRRHQPRRNVVKDVEAVRELLQLLPCAVVLTQTVRSKVVSTSTQGIHRTVHVRTYAIAALAGPHELERAQPVLEVHDRRVRRHVGPDTVVLIDLFL